MFATFQENPVQLERVLRGYSWSLADERIELMYRPPVDLLMDEWVYDLLDLVERTGAKRVVIDSLGDLRAVCQDELGFREYMYSLLQRCGAKSSVTGLRERALVLTVRPVLGTAPTRPGVGVPHASTRGGRA